MNHLILCREFPPAPYPSGGIGTYLRHISRLLAEAGETVHIVAQRWEGASAPQTSSCDGKLIIHRVSLDVPAHLGRGNSLEESRLLRGFAKSNCPSQAFAWQAARVAEHLIASEAIDVVEGQEWEAPLYYLQLRRALGLGPRHQPPCLVHLHSPSHLIFQHNNWDLSLTDLLPLERMEEYTVKAADALLCPSGFLARQSEQLFSLPAGEVTVIPYPLGESGCIARSEEVWARDSICYVGRLELRKGIIEWVDAAVEVARSNNRVTFDFIGGDTSLTGGPGTSVQQYLRRRIPGSLRSQFRFFGDQPRAKVRELLANASAAAVPSRWENLPYSCIEAMASGLPVLVSPHGGMSELVTDGESGWVAPDLTPAGLRNALQRFLETTPARRATMGNNAMAAVNEKCANRSVLRRQVEFRAELARTGCSRSQQIAPAPPVSTGSRQACHGMGLVVTCSEVGELGKFIANIQGQKNSAEKIVVVASDRYQGSGKLAKITEIPNWSVIYQPGSDTASHQSVGAASILAGAPHLRGVAFTDTASELDAHYLGIVDAVFQREPALGLLSSWMANGSEVLTDALLQSATDTTLLYSAVRTEVLLAASTPGPQTPGMLPTKVREELTSGNWSAIAYPALLVSIGKRGMGQQKKRYSVMVLAQRSSASLSLTWFLAAPLAEKARWLRNGLKQPHRTLEWLLWQARSFARGELSLR